jgi:SAM-dependent methyltransferase
MNVDQDKMNAFMMKFVQDMGAMAFAPTVIIGERLGLYKAMAGAGPMSPVDLAKKTGTAERNIKEWLAAQAASNYVTYNSKTGMYTLPPEQAYALADENSPVYLPGAFQLVSALMKDEPKLEKAFKSGKGLGWHEHDVDLFVGTEKFFRPAYAGNLVSAWLPALDGVVAKLQRGARVADVGCGLGASTRLMAKAYPKSEFIGYDYHPESIDLARKAAEKEGLGKRVKFEVAPAKSYPGRDFDLVAFFDCLHDMGDPAGAAAHTRKSLKSDGTWMIVEPFANEKIEDNLNPIGRIYYSASSMICVPASMNQEVGAALGAQAGDSQLEKIVRGAGFSKFRRATETPFNRVFEARP